MTSTASSIEAQAAEMGNVEASILDGEFMESELKAHFLEFFRCRVFFSTPSGQP